MLLPIPSNCGLLLHAIASSSSTKVSSEPITRQKKSTLVSEAIFQDLSFKGPFFSNLWLTGGHCAPYLLTFIATKKKVCRMYLCRHQRHHHLINNQTVFAIDVKEDIDYDYRIASSYMPLVLNLRRKESKSSGGINPISSRFAMPTYNGRIWRIFFTAIAYTYSYTIYVQQFFNGIRYVLCFCIVTYRCASSFL